MEMAPLPLGWKHLLAPPCWPSVFWKASTRFCTSAWISSSPSLLPMPRSRSASRVNFLSCFHRSPLAKKTPAQRARFKKELAPSSRWDASRALPWICTSLAGVCVYACVSVCLKSPGHRTTFRNPFSLLPCGNQPKVVSFDSEHPYPLIHLPGTNTPEFLRWRLSLVDICSHCKAPQGFSVLAWGIEFQCSFVVGRYSTTEQHYQNMIKQVLFFQRNQHFSWDSFQPWAFTTTWCFEIVCALQYPPHNVWTW